MRKALMILSAAALLAVVFASPASAQLGGRDLGPINRGTVLTFSGPVSLPNVTLPAGSYLFKFADAPYNSILRVLSEDGETVYATMHTIPIVRTETESNHNEIVTFRETAADQPPAIDAWFFDASEKAIGDTDLGCELNYGE